MSLKECRIALYSHDTVGIGHMRRNLLLARALVNSPLRPTVLLIAGAREATLFSPPPRVDYVTLPSLCKLDSGQYGSRNLDLPSETIIRLRQNVIHSAVDAFEPDLLIVDKVPRGVLRELDPTLAALHSRGRTRCVLGLRDILDDPTIVRGELVADAWEQTIDRYYDQVWIYGSRSMYDVAKEYGISNSVSTKFHYTGYLNRITPFDDGEAAKAPVIGSFSSDGSRGRMMLCMLGGGQDGMRLADAFLAADLPSDATGILLTGPFLPTAARQQLRRRAELQRNRVVLEFFPQPEMLIRQADRVISMGGYNTVCEVVAAGTHALIVPRVTPRREQLIRAERFSKLGLLEMLHPDVATPASLSKWLKRDLPSRSSLPSTVDFGGLSQVPKLAAAILSSNSSAVSAAGTSTVNADGASIPVFSGVVHHVH